MKKTYFFSSLLLLSISPTQADAQLSVLHSFAGGVDGARPNASVIESNGNLFGTTWSNPQAGTFYQIINGVYSSTYIPAALSSNNPQGLTVAVDGNIYGITQGLGGEYGYGEIYRVNTVDSTLTPIYTFAGGVDGAAPVGSLVSGPNNYLYGVTAIGGASNAGTVFRLSLDGTFKNLHSFDGVYGGGLPIGLTIGTDGLYGITQRGGAYNRGILFRIASDVVTVMYSFLPTQTPYSITGASDGSLYGTTLGSSAQGGCIFRINNGVFTLLHCLTHIEGESPGTLLESNGFLYGTSQSGGIFNGGTLFRVSLNGNITTVLFSFSNNTNGWSPRSPLIQRHDGSFTGVTRYGGVSCLDVNDNSGCGVVFSYQVPSEMTSVPGFLVNSHAERP